MSEGTEWIHQTRRIHLPAAFTLTYKNPLPSTEEGYAHKYTFTPNLVLLTLKLSDIIFLYSILILTPEVGYEESPPILPPCSELTVFTCADHLTGLSSLIAGRYEAPVDILAQT